MNDHGKAWLSRFALQSAEFIEQRKTMIDVLDLTEAEITGIRDLVEYHHDVITHIEELLPDIDLIAAHDRANDQLSDDEFAAIDAEIRRRNLWGKPIVSWGKDYDDRVKAMPDHELLIAYQATSGDAGDRNSDAILAEIERRNLDV